MTQNTPHRGYLATLAGAWCPRCREGKIFRWNLSWRTRKNLDMYERCPVCGQVTDIEVGFYYGTGYISYLVALLLSGISFLVWYLLIGFSYKDQRFLVWICLNSLLLVAGQPWLMRFSRIFWLSCFVSYNPDWAHTPPDEPERINKEQMNNW